MKFICTILISNDMTNYKEIEQISLNCINPNRFVTQNMLILAKLFFSCITTLVTKSANILYKNAIF